MHGQISTKSDVYSFGVLVLEIVTGKKCTGFHGLNPPSSLISHVKTPTVFDFVALDTENFCNKSFHISYLCRCGGFGRKGIP